MKTSVTNSTKIKIKKKKKPSKNKTHIKMILTRIG